MTREKGQGFSWRTRPELVVPYFRLSHYVTEGSCRANRGAALNIENAGGHTRPS